MRNFINNPCIWYSVVVTITFRTWRSRIILSASFQFKHCVITKEHRNAFVVYLTAQNIIRHWNANSNWLTLFPYSNRVSTVHSSHKSDPILHDQVRREDRDSNSRPTYEKSCFRFAWTFLLKINFVQYRKLCDATMSYNLSFCLSLWKTIICVSLHKSGLCVSTYQRQAACIRPFNVIQPWNSFKSFTSSLRHKARQTPSTVLKFKIYAQVLSRTRSDGFSV
jgi:hypothetical protein